MHSYDSTFDTGFIQVDTVHKIYYEQYGNPEGKPILFLHGGPGAGCSSFQKRFFDCKKYRVIFFDQRGSGKSLPYAETNKNTTKDLTEDIELIRKFLKIKNWLIFGGSWGSTLALLYGIKFPKNCSGFLLRGVFLGTKKEIDWFLYDMKKFFPEAHEKFVSKIPKTQKHDILNWYKNKLNSKNKNSVLSAAKDWNEYESSCSTLRYVVRRNSGSDSLAIAKIENHYFVNNCFLKDNFIINNLNKIKHLPSVIIQGRHDVICPPFNAMRLSKLLPKSNLKIVEDAGHSAFEDGVFKEVLNSLNNIY